MDHKKQIKTCIAVCCGAVFYTFAIDLPISVKYGGYDLLWYFEENGRLPFDPSLLAVVALAFVWAADLYRLFGHAC